MDVLNLAHLPAEVALDGFVAAARSLRSVTTGNLLAADVKVGPFEHAIQKWLESRACQWVPKTMVLPRNLG